MRLAFVLARYGRQVLGGAETLAKGLAIEAARRGWDVEVWTTCAVDYTTWANVLAPGMEEEDGVLVRRFPVDVWHPEGHRQLNQRLQLHRGLETKSEYEWVFSGPHSSKLNQHILQNAGNFDAIITMPYIQSLTFDAAWLAGDHVVLLPCLHDELTAYMEPFRVLMESVSGVVFISPEEARFAVAELGVEMKRSAVIGVGVEQNLRGDSGFVREDSPYLLYVGRLEKGKNVHLLYDYVRRYTKEGGDLKLVVAGDGPFKPPDSPEFEYLGPVSDEVKSRLYREALALCQPSSNESFSLVIMESWLAMRPVLVWAGCDVTRGHVQRSKGGLWFGNYGEFKEAVEWLKKHDDTAARMGVNGRRYVRENFSWPLVFDRFASTLSSWGFGEPL